MRIRLWLLCGSLILAFGCTPEATVVEPSGGGSNGMAGGPAGNNNGGRGGNQPGGNCAVLKSPRVGCAACLTRECAQEVKDCAMTSACSCGDFGDSKGQFNCLLACESLTPMMEAADACAQMCGFGGLGMSNPKTLALFNCFANPPGPPKCGQECVE